MIKIISCKTETWYYYHFDGLGSVIALSDANGDLVESYSYNVFGSPTIYDGDGNEISASAIGNPYMFTGRRYEQETGLYYYRLRDYDAKLGRFLQNDPIGYAGGLNLYAYCNNNPANYVDPMGLRTVINAIEIQESLELGRLASGLPGGIIPIIPLEILPFASGARGSGSSSGDSDGMPTKGKPPYKIRGHQFSISETQEEIERAKNDYDPFTSGISSLEGGFDYLVTGQTFYVPGLGRLTGEEFGNYIAGYKNTYQYGPFGALGAFGFGVFFAWSEGDYWDSWNDIEMVSMGGSDAQDDRVEQLVDVILEGGPTWPESPYVLPCKCFVAGTKVAMSDSSQGNIEDIKVGDIVKTYNFKTGKIEGQVVMGVRKGPHKELVNVTFSNGIEIVSTDDHPYYVINKGLCSYSPELTKRRYGIKVKKLELSDTCFMLHDDQLTEAQIVEIQLLSKLVETYNISEIKGSNSYFANGVLVRK